jgi:L-fuconolactonase
MVQDRPADWYDDPGLAPAFQGMSEHGLKLDALVRVQHLASLDRLALRWPRLAIVIDHAAKPAIEEPYGYSRWYDAIAPLAERANVSCKLSGLLTECPPDRRQPEVLAPYVDALLDLFGPDRLMWGSDWPVLNLAGEFGEWLGMARMLVGEAAHRAVFEQTALRFYGLKAGVHLA